MYLCYSQRVKVTMFRLGFNMQSPIVGKFVFHMTCRSLSLIFLLTILQNIRVYEWIILVKKWEMILLKPDTRKSLDINKRLNNMMVRSAVYGRWWHVKMTATTHGNDYILLVGEEIEPNVKRGKWAKQLKNHSLRGDCLVTITTTV